MVGVIVDGFGDFSSIKARFSGRCRVLKADGPRGHTVTATRLVSSAKKQVSILRSLGCQQVILLFDFEQRNEEYEDFLDVIRQEIDKQNFPVHVQPCVPNTMIENWYLSDIEEISKKRAYIRSNLNQKNYEGKHGKNEIKKLVTRGVKYNEIEHGTQLFLTIRLENAARNSASFKAFIEYLISCETM